MKDRSVVQDVLVGVALAAALALVFVLAFGVAAP